MVSHYAYDRKGMDNAIIKATRHKVELPKEKHIRAILDSCSGSRPRADVVYCIQSLAKRLSKTQHWTVALKTLIVIHRALREGDPAFVAEIINYNRSTLMLNLSYFTDESSTLAWDYSAWIRAYALYLEERVECFRVLKYDVQKDYVKIKRMDTAHLLEQIPILQHLLFRLLGCKPEGAAFNNSLIHYALAIVVGESVKLYVAITDGLLNLVDKYFEMQRDHATKTLKIYKNAGSQAESLTELFEICRALDFGRGQKYIRIERPPAEFMVAMEEYVKDAPESLGVDAQKVVAMPAADSKEEYEAAATNQIADLLGSDEFDTDVKEVTTSEVAATQQLPDLLGFDDITPEVSGLDEKNSLALAVVPSENASSSAVEPMSWELALVETASSNAGSKPGGVLDKSTLDSLYDNALAIRANQNNGNYMQVASNPFETDCSMQDPFYSFTGIAPPSNVQMTNMGYQQQNFMMQNHYHHQQQQPSLDGQNPTNVSSNPFLEQSVPSHTPQNYYPGLI